MISPGGHGMVWYGLERYGMLYCMTWLPGGHGMVYDGMLWINGYVNFMFYSIACSSGPAHIWKS